MGIAASMTSGPIPSPAITAIRQVFNGLSFEARRLPAREAVGPADVDRTAARGTLEVAFLRLAAMRPQVSRDRKSTRLNSSHVAISYAVFCLKKKKKKKQRR